MYYARIIWTIEINYADSYSKSYIKFSRSFLLSSYF